ncbi:MAG: FAD-dependent oxidoreductase, partial [Chloroflexi bacterium]|nr:FAD-dependent oxidoreductase [Chloroflexota bacterium]
QDVATRTGAQLLNLNLELSRRMLDLTEDAPRETIIQGINSMMEHSSRASRVDAPFVHALYQLLADRSEPDPIDALEIIADSSFPLEGFIGRHPQAAARILASDTTRAVEVVRASDPLRLPPARLIYRIAGVNPELAAKLGISPKAERTFYDLVVVGGGNSGVEEGLFLTKFASKVTVLEIGERLRASQVLREKLAEHPRMEVRLQTTVEEFRGNGHLKSVVVKDLATGETEELRPGAVFIFIGLDPNTDFLKGTVDRDGWNFITTGPTLESSLTGVFAAGDARAGSTKQVASAVGEGATAALMIRQYLESGQGNRGYRGD